MASPILNKKELAVTPLRKDACAILEAGYNAIEIAPLVRRRMNRDKDILHIHSHDEDYDILLSDASRVVVIGFGKGSYTAVTEIAHILGPYAKECIALDVKASCRPKKLHKDVRVFWGTHPTPSAANVRATNHIMDVAASLGEDDVVLYVVAGGGSSLLCGSVDEMEGGKKVFSLLTRKGASIAELNVVRKHLSIVKGGGLAKFSFPARAVSLIVSDVCGNDFGTIASGPTVYDNNTIDDALAVLKKYRVPAKGLVFVETPKEKKFFTVTKALLFACNQDAVMAMQEKARELGYVAKVISLALEKEAKELFSPMLEKVKKGQALIGGGESTVTLSGTPGNGGRNQEAVLAAIVDAYDGEVILADTVVASIASDGYDNTSVAGAIADDVLMREIVSGDINPTPYLAGHNAYPFFKKIGGHVCVERKHFNVSDLFLVIKKVTSNK
jgi:glycerate-2-kinase